MIAGSGDETKVDKSVSQDDPVPLREAKKRSRAQAAGEGMCEVEEDRKSANRRAALQSRLRKKVLTDDLQQQVNKLLSELSTLKEENRSLSQNLESSLAENRRLRFVQQHTGLLARQGGALGNQNAFLGGLQASGFGGVIGFQGF